MAVVPYLAPETETDIAGELAAAAAHLQRSTVHVRTEGMGAGSGVIWQPDGLIVTNAHVARGAEAAVELWDGRTFDGRVVARDQQRDLAAVTIQAADLPAASVADSDTLRVGQLAIAVGNPFGLSGALTFGIIHAVAPAEGRGRQAWVQADVRLLPGNSGGPLADVQGRVIGINSMVAGGLGLAVPSNAVSRFLESGRRPRVGITIQPVMVPHSGRNTPGLLVLEVAPGSPADAAGLLVGDIVAGIGSASPREPGDLLRALADLRPGITVQLDLLRGGTLTHRQLSVPATGEEPIHRSGEAA